MTRAKGNCRQPSFNTRGAQTQKSKHTHTHTHTHTTDMSRCIAHAETNVFTLTEGLKFGTA